MNVVHFPSTSCRTPPAPVERSAVDDVPTVADPDEEKSRIIDDLLIYYYRIIFQEDGVPESMIRIILDAIPTGRRPPGV